MSVVVRVMVVPGMACLQHSAYLRHILSLAACSIADTTYFPRTDLMNAQFFKKADRSHSFLVFYIGYRFASPDFIINTSGSGWIRMYSNEDAT